MAAEIEEVTDLDATWEDLRSLFLAFEEYSRRFQPGRVLRDDWEARLRERLRLHDDRLVLLARVDGAAIGQLIAVIRRDDGMALDEYAYLSHAFVVQEYRSDGIGRRLLRRAEDWARGRGVERIELDVLSANKVGVRFWTLAGFGLESLTMKKSLR